jgi:2-C-methyl-D-erythritol 4-phosphate cytidylyltransferase / 2-C-methyl-D-erythritol 2,4-cyclodiphosphate synthase
MPSVAVIVVAAGSGTRLGAAEPKAFVEVNGRAILEHALLGVFDATEPAQVIVVAPQTKLAAARAIAKRVAGSAGQYVTVVTGGDTRQASVAAGLAAVDADVDTVLVHDAARALTPATLFERVVGAVRRWGGGVIPALPVSDTIKRVAPLGGGDGAAVRETVDRSELVHVQRSRRPTPRPTGSTPTMPPCSRRTAAR